MPKSSASKKKTTKKVAVNRGLGNYLPELKPAAGKVELGRIPISTIRIPPEMELLDLDMEHVKRIANTASVVGQRDNIEVEVLDDGYVLVDGRHRLKAFGDLLGWTEVGAYTCPDTHASVDRILKNVVRRQVSPYEEATLIQVLIGEKGHTQEEAAESLGISTATVKSRLKLLKVPATIAASLKDEAALSTVTKFAAFKDHPELAEEIGERIASYEVDFSAHHVDHTLESIIRESAKAAGYTVVSPKQIAGGWEARSEDVKKVEEAARKAGGVKWGGAYNALNLIKDKKTFNELSKPVREKIKKKREKQRTASVSRSGGSDLDYQAVSNETERLEREDFERRFNARLPGAPVDVVLLEYQMVRDLHVWGDGFAFVQAMTGLSRQEIADLTGHGPSQLGKFRDLRKEKPEEISKLVFYALLDSADNDAELAEELGLKTNAERRKQAEKAIRAAQKKKAKDAEKTPALAKKKAVKKAKPRKGSDKAKPGEPPIPLKGVELDPKGERPVAQACRECGCTNEDGCLEGCTWTEPDLCSVCAELLADEAKEEADTAAATVVLPEGIVAIKTKKAQVHYHLQDESEAWVLCGDAKKSQWTVSGHAPLRDEVCQPCLVGLDNRKEASG